MSKVNSYLLFDGTCKEAMEFYQSVFGAELELTTLGSSPMAAAFPDTLHGSIVHARLRNSEIDIPASDWLAQGETPIRGNMNCMYVNSGTPEKTREYFEKLAVGGEITDPYSEQPFGWYGRLIDAFGVIWMFHAVK